jgi:hypothetical protein
MEPGVELKSIVIENNNNNNGSHSESNVRTPTEVIHPKHNVDLEKIKKISMKQRYIARKSSYFYRKMSYGLTIPMIVMNSIMAILSGNNNSSLWLSYLTTSTFILNTIFTGLKAYLKFEEKLLYYEKEANTFEDILFAIDCGKDSNSILKMFEDAVGKKGDLVPPEYIVEEASKKFGGDIV